MLAAEYVVVDVSGDVSAATVIAYAAGLILLAELLQWPSVVAASALADPTVVTAKAVMLAALTAAAALLALVVLASTSLELPRAFEAALLGSAAAVTLLALPGFQAGGRGRRLQADGDEARRKRLRG